MKIIVIDLAESILILIVGVLNVVGNLDWRKIMLVILVTLLILALINLHKDFLKIVYPIYYESLVFDSAIEHDLDPYLILAIMYVESKFDPQSTSDQGARGLMQIMPQTGDWIASSLGDEEFSVKDLYKPAINIKYASWYLARLRDGFNSRLPVVLAAYNGGQGNVGKWLKNKEWDGKQENIGSIPFSSQR
jgi:soluble lytic murein transglycosylase